MIKKLLLSIKCIEISRVWQQRDLFFEFSRDINLIEDNIQNSRSCRSSWEFGEHVVIHARSHDIYRVHVSSCERRRQVVSVYTFPMRDSCVPVAFWLQSVHTKDGWAMWIWYSFRVSKLLWFTIHRRSYSVTMKIVSIYAMSRRYPSNMWILRQMELTAFIFLQRSISLCVFA